MSVLIKGMKMPTEGCRDCPVVRRGSVYDICPFLRKAVDRNVEWGDKPDDCPLVEVPTPHGNLIDRDKLLKKGINLSWSVQKWVSEVDIGLMPAIIEAEEEKHD